jgi:hypothetical protein
MRPTRFQSRLQIAWWGRFGCGPLLVLLLCLGCQSAGTQRTFQRPYPEVRNAIRKVCANLSSPTSDALVDAAHLTSSSNAPVRQPAYVGPSREVPDESYVVIVWDTLSSFAYAPHMTIRAERISDDSTRVYVRSETPAESSMLAKKRRPKHETKTLSQIAAQLGL